MEKLNNGINEVTGFDGYYISYNPMCNAPMDDDEETGRKSDETALVKDGNFYILYGDYREEMIEAAKKGGFEEAKKIFDSRPDEHSFWSN